MIFYAEKNWEAKLCFKNIHFQERSDCVPLMWCQIYPNEQVDYLLHCSHSFR